MRDTRLHVMLVQLSDKQKERRVKCNALCMNDYTNTTNEPSTEAVSTLTSPTSMVSTLPRVYDIHN